MTTHRPCCFGSGKVNIYANLPGRTPEKIMVECPRQKSIITDSNINKHMKRRCRSRCSFDSEAKDYSKLTPNLNNMQSPITEMVTNIAKQCNKMMDEALLQFINDSGFDSPQDMHEKGYLIHINQCNPYQIDHSCVTKYDFIIYKESDHTVLNKSEFKVVLG